MNGHQLPLFQSPLNGYFPPAASNSFDLLSGTVLDGQGCWEFQSKNQPREKECEKNILNLLVDRDNKVVQRKFLDGEPDYSKGKPDYSNVKVSFSRSQAMWYCFERIFDAGEQGTTGDELRKKYPGERHAWRQAIADLNNKLAVLGVKATRCPDGEYRLVEIPFNRFAQNEDDLT